MSNLYTDRLAELLQEQAAARALEEVAKKAHGVTTDALVIAYDRVEATNQAVREELFVLKDRLLAEAQARL